MVRVLNLPYVEEKDISTAYLRSFEKVVNAPRRYVFCLVTKISEPILKSIDKKVDVIESEIKGTRKRYVLEGLNIDETIHRNFKEFPLYMDKKGRKWFGRDKIADRIYELEEGKYHRDLEKKIKGNKKQLEYLLGHLKNGKVRGWHNSLICIVFDPNRDLCYPNARCLMSIDFKPEVKRNKLHLIANWRAQYFNTKAYGNFLSLARLLRKVCKERGFQPGNIISIAHKAILERRVKDNRLLEKLKETW
jgi:thymidylate synthase